jgi:NADH-quinone oxidoreductase subunit M
MGGYGLIRIALPFAPAGFADSREVIAALGIIGIVWGAATALVQTDLKRLVAYSSVAHMGFCVLGIFSLTVNGLNGSILVMVNHGITTGALFLLVGMLYERRHTREIADLSGLQKAAPIMAAVFTLVMLASVGLPGLNGFPGEFLSLLGAFEGARWWAVVAVSGVIIAALYLLWAYQRTFHGPATGENATMKDLRPYELAVLAPLLGLIVFLGLYPTPLLERMEPSVEQLVAHVDLHSDDLTVTEYRFEGPAEPSEGGATEGEASGGEGGG